MTTTTTRTTSVETHPTPAADVRPAAIRAEGLTLGYAGEPVVDGVDIDVEPGEILVVLGHSGCGKSTLLRAFAGLLRPLAGRVVADGGDVTGPDAERALVFQDDALLPWRTARRNVELPLKLHGVARRERRRVAEQWLERVGLSRYAERLPGQLSGGMRQRVQLARALAGSPGLICMDEPFGALDAQTRGSMQQLLVETWADSGCTVVFVTHDVDEAMVLADRIVVLGRHGIVSEHRLLHPRDPGRPPRPEQRAEILEALTRTQSLAPVTRRTDPAKDLA
ncbi:ABC transporter ATP-binding protein [Nocardioides sp. GXQ0305]|uniref:ABC transporter ATP-binding protein n=1 Tax=Nocardioides sp. GXQ0305 TaxID=3423912 RepID=UPI003D7D9858